MPKPLDPAKREAIADALRDGYGTRSAGSIAKEFGVAVSTVTKIAREDGLNGSFERAQTKNATRARTVDMAAERAALQERWLRKANEALDRSEEPCLVYAFSAGTGMYSEHVLDKPPAGEYRSFVTAAAVATDKLVALAKYDAKDDGVDRAVTVIDNLMGALRGQVANAGDSD